MPTLDRAPNERELEKLVSIYLKAETDIINEIGRLRSMGNVDYHAAAALERVQAILRKMENDAWTYSRPMVEKQFYARAPEARRIEGETAEKHLAGYANAAALTGDQHAIVDQLTAALMGEITDAAMTAMATVQSAVIGRIEPDVYRRTGLEQVAGMQARGRGVNASVPGLVEALRREGVTAFVDRAGRNWSLHTYCSMVTRTTSRQAEVMAVLTADPGHDLYMISSHGTTCPLCAPFEGRVYSRSGTDPDFPPLAAAFGKVDPAGPDTLANTWLNIHPNCLHVLLPWTSAGRTPEEVQKIKDFSDPRKNPFTRDPRSQKQIEAYRKKEAARAGWLREYRQWERYRMALGDQVPKTFATWQEHKAADDEKYRKWKTAYIAATRDRGIIKQKLSRGELNLKINPGHQKKHIRGLKEYVEGRSYIYGTIEDTQRLVDKYSGSGEPKFDKRGRWVNKEFVNASDPIGVYVDAQTKEETPTSRFSIHYGAKGTHVVPAKEDPP